MENLFHASRLTTFGSGGRNYDYTNIYGPDKPGEEIKDNARVWNVYLDEAGSHDADMIEGFQSIIHNLLVFAALFSAVVTTFVAQTSRVLQPDNMQIMVSLLAETNQLLRAAGNGSSVNAVPAASLGPESRTYTSRDIWVNGLFFTSLALSLSTALLSVLAKQWIHAYTATVSGDAKTRAFIRQFRFQGLEKYKLGEIIESLPLILHCSVALFLVGLALYVSQLSGKIWEIVAAITATTFGFYLVSSMIPAWDIACPYRIPFVFYITKLLLFCSPGQSFKRAEHDKVLGQSSYDADHLAYNSFAWIFNHSSNNSVKRVIIEAACCLLDNWSINHRQIQYFLSKIDHNFLVSAIEYSLSRLAETYSTSSMEDETGNNKYGLLIGTFMRVFNLKTLLDEPIAGLKDWQDEIGAVLFKAYEAALRDRHRVLSRWLLDLGGPNLLQSGSQWGAEFLFQCAYNGDAEDFRELMHRGIDFRYNSGSLTALHCAAFTGNLDVAIALVELDPALISVEVGIFGKYTVLDMAVLQSLDNSHMMVTYLLNHGAQLSRHDSLDLRRVMLLLDCGWDRTVKDVRGFTLLDIARQKGDYVLFKFLKHYQTVKLPPYGIVSQSVNEETP